MSEDNPPGKGNPTKVQIMGILQYEDGRVSNARDFTLDMRKSSTLCPMNAVIGSKSDCGKTTVCSDLITLFNQNGNKVGIAKLSGTARRGELLSLGKDANQWLDLADAGLPTTYPPSEYGEESASLAARHAVTAAECVLQRCHCVGVWRRFTCGQCSRYLSRACTSQHCRLRYGSRISYSCYRYGNKAAQQLRILQKHSEICCRSCRKSAGQ